MSQWCQNNAASSIIRHYSGNNPLATWLGCSFKAATLRQCCSNILNFIRESFCLISSNILNNWIIISPCFLFIFLMDPNLLPFSKNNSITTQHRKTHGKISIGRLNSIKKRTLIHYKRINLICDIWMQMHS